jgi:NTP pyrophosphatase (non-canonical NTP hydrolase)
LDYRKSRRRYMKLNDLVQEAHRNARIKGWWTEPRSPLEIHMLMVSEIAEATECVRHGTPPVYVDEETGKLEGEAVELVDVLIRLLDYFGYKEWDLETVLKAKMEYNEGRSYRHGGKLY